jgi:hypothetical protein
MIAAAVRDYERTIATPMMIQIETITGATSRQGMDISGISQKKIARTPIFRRFHDALTGETVYERCTNEGTPQSAPIHAFVADPWPAFSISLRPTPRQFVNCWRPCYTHAISSAKETSMPWLSSATSYDTMRYNRCGRSGLKLPAVSLGLWHNFGGVDALENARAMLRRAFDLGITHFDLANNYGPPPGSAEENFGHIFKQDLAAHRD